MNPLIERTLMAGVKNTDNTSLTLDEVMQQMKWIFNLYYFMRIGHHFQVDTMEQLDQPWNVAGVKEMIRILDESEGESTYIVERKQLEQWESKPKDIPALLKCYDSLAGLFNLWQPEALQLVVGARNVTVCTGQLGGLDGCLVRETQKRKYTTIYEALKTYLVVKHAEANKINMVRYTEAISKGYVNHIQNYFGDSTPKIEFDFWALTYLFGIEGLNSTQSHAELLNQVIYELIGVYDEPKDTKSVLIRNTPFFRKLPDGRVDHFRNQYISTTDGWHLFGIETPDDVITIGHALRKLFPE